MSLIFKNSSLNNLDLVFFLILHEIFFMQSERKYNKHLCKKGEKYGRLTLTGKTHSRSLYGQLRRMVEAECECGNMGWYLLATLVRQETRSCGCLRRDVARERMTTHGLTQHPLYDVYQAMLQRCYIESCKSYPDYGARGIEVCDQWQENFVVFYEWAMLSGWKEGMSLERKDNDGNYSPGNCHFVGGVKDRKVQNRNTRRNKNITAFGETKCLFDWGKDPRCKVTVWALRSRFDRGKWTDMEAMITTPQTERKSIQRNMKSNRNITAFGETKCLSAWVEDERCVVSLDGFRDRMDRGIEPEVAMTTPSTVRMGSFILRKKSA